MADVPVKPAVPAPAKPAAPAPAKPAAPAPAKPAAPAPAKPAVPPPPPKAPPAPPTKADLEKRLNRVNQDIEMFNRMIEGHQHVLAIRSQEKARLEKQIAERK